jgi:uncharacterized protein
MLSILFGLISGLALGLTGSGGSLFTLPLLVYGLGVDPREAVGVSLFVVGCIAFYGMMMRSKTKELCTYKGIVVAMSGAVGAPIGGMICREMPQEFLLCGFAGLMIIIAVYTWRRACCAPEEASAMRADLSPLPQKHKNNRRSSAILAGGGLISGTLAGLFGVGGGFLIVPTLMVFGRLTIHEAVATSLLVISFVSLSGVSSYFIAGGTIPYLVSALFLIGGIAGLSLGIVGSKKLAGPQLQKVFSLMAGLTAAGIFIYEGCLGFKLF